MAIYIPTAQAPVNAAAANQITTGIVRVDMKGLRRFSVHSVATVNTPSAALSAAAAVTTGTDTITATAHGFTTGLKGQFTTSGGLPAGLSTSTDYFIVVVDANNYKVATSLANALIPTVVDITTQGTGNHTFTPTALAGATVQFIWSNRSDAILIDPYTYTASHWNSVGAAIAITVTAPNTLQVVDPEYRMLGIVSTLTAGRISFDNFVQAERF